jgi:hypothetical protein
MITRAQAEALLTLAESLEACERLGMTVESSDLVADVGLTFDDRATLRARGPMLSAMDIRIIVNNLVPKRSGRLPDPPNYQET